MGNLAYAMDETFYRPPDKRELLNTFHQMQTSGLPI